MQTQRATYYGTFNIDLLTAAATLTSRGIQSMTVDGNGHLQVVYDDGTAQDLGPLPTGGAKSAPGVGITGVQLDASNHLVFTYTDGTTGTTQGAIPPWNGGTVTQPADFTAGQTITGGQTVDTVSLAGQDLAGSIAGKVVKGDLIFNVRDYGAVGDCTADDTAAIRAAIANLCTAAVKNGQPGGTLEFPNGTYLISDTIVITQLSIRIKGHGWSNSTNYGSVSGGKGTLFAWKAGSGNKPMMQFNNCFGIGLESVRFTSAPQPLSGSAGPPPAADLPTAAVEFLAGGNQGGNTKSILRDVYIGRWGPTGEAAGTYFTNGVLFDGPNVNNDQFSLQNCQFDSCATGLSLPNTQSVWGRVEDTRFVNCGTGVDTASSVQLDNPGFETCGLDFRVRSTARVMCTGYNSEFAQQLVLLDGGSHFSARGGYQQLQDIVGPYFIDGNGSLSGQAVILRDTVFTTPTPATPVATTIRMKPSAGTQITGDPPLIHVENCRGIGFANLADCGLVDVNDQRRVFYRDSAGNEADQLLTGGQALGLNVMRAGVRVEADYPLAVGESTIDRSVPLGYGAVATAAGVVYLTFFTARRSETITQLAVITASTAAAGNTAAKLGVYSENADGSLTLAGACTSDTTLFTAAYTRYQRGLAAALAKVGGQRYAVAVLNVGATTAPTFIGPVPAALIPVSNLMFTAPHVTAQTIAATYTNLPATLAASAIEATYPVVYAELLP